MKYTAFLGVRFEPEWFLMDSAEREKFESEHVFPILAKHAQFLTIRPFRASAFSSRHTNFFLVHFDDIPSYDSLIEEMRARPLMANRYATITDNFIGIEAAHYTEGEEKAA
ncbi:darcynin family protein [Streptomyces sp. NPDC050564]|uniref:darcynin family protein n=1 Tax=Streptomyces sp. NPDC050564 TaxID=3365631 RepID=UPI003796D95D